MFAIVCTADGYPVTRHAGNDALVVTWISQAAAAAFLTAKGLDPSGGIAGLSYAGAWASCAGVGANRENEVKCSCH